MSQSRRVPEFLPRRVLSQRLGTRSVMGDEVTHTRRVHDARELECDRVPINHGCCIAGRNDGVEDGQE